MGIFFFQNSLPTFENNVNPDQLASEEAIRSRSTLFSTPIENTCLQQDCGGKISYPPPPIYHLYI